MRTLVLVVGIGLVLWAVAETWVPDGVLSPEEASYGGLRMIAAVAVVLGYCFFSRRDEQGGLSRQEPLLPHDEASQTGPPEETKAAVTYTFVVSFDGRERKIVERWEKREVLECPELRDRFDAVALDMKDFKREVVFQGEPAIRKVKDDTTKGICFADVA